MSECIFCKIVNGEIPCKKIYGDDKILVFHDIDPQAPVHALIIPKAHIASLDEINEDNQSIAAHIHVNIPRIARELGIAESGYRVVVNCGKDGGQAVGHLHYHLLGGRSLKWPPG